MENATIFEMLTGKKETTEISDLELFKNLFNGLPPLEILSILSAQYYEKKEMRAKIIFYDSNCNIECSPKYKDTILFDQNNKRQITKFLAASTDDTPLVAQLQTNIKFPEYIIKGIATAKNTHCISEIIKPLFVVSFVGHMQYDLYMGSRLLLSYEEGKYKCPKDTSEHELLGEILKVNGWKITDEQIEALKYNLNELAKAKHGTTFVFMKCADLYDYEVDRLIGKAKRGVKIDPVSLYNKDEKVVSFLRNTAVADGGFLVNEKGDCNAINVIFDGEVKSEYKNFEGRSDRGSRYNSLYTYIFGKNQKCNFFKKCNSKRIECKKCEKRAIAVVISDDGIINVLSDAGTI